MKKKYRNMIFILAIVIAFIINVECVFAKDDSDSYLPACIDDNTCMLLCEYNNIRTSEQTDKLAIYYSHSYKKLRIAYTTGGGKRNYTKSLESCNYYQGEPLNENNFSCPKYAFINDAGINELCLSTEKDYCLEIDGTFSGKKFSGTSTLIYNYINEITNYFNDYNYYSGISCDNFDLELFKTKQINDFNNILNGNSMPAFLKNDETYKKENAKQQNKVKNFLEKCEKKIKDDKTLSEGEKDEKLSKLNYSDDEIEEALSQVNSEIGYSPLTYQEAGKLTCDSLLGSVDSPDDPAYYLNMAFNIIKYLAIIMLFVFTMADYLKAVLSKDDDELNKSTSRFVKRFVIAVIIFVLPTLIIMLLKWGGFIDSSTLCGIAN